VPKSKQGVAETEQVAFCTAHVVPGIDFNNGTKAFIHSFSFALRNELKDTAVRVTCLMPGAADMHFLERADMLDTRVASGEKASPANVAKEGCDAMKAGKDHVVAGWKNKVSGVTTNVLPDSMLAEQLRKTAEPGSASH